jgi:HD superfamily phosphohydrolase
MKYLYDVVHGMCEIPHLAQQFIYTYEFQRMRSIKQLGLSYYIFPSASGNRFEHSIATGNLARIVGLHLQKEFPNLVSDRFIDLIQIAGLTHDIGHGPMSHTFDTFVEDSESVMKIHENRSKSIVKFMVDKYKIPLTTEEVEFICETFDPSVDNKYKWQYQIISAEVDVDRLDYILRDSNNTGIPITFTQHQVFMLIKCMKIVDDKLVFDKKADKFIHDMLYSRKHLYSRVYKHKKSIAIEQMLKIVFEKMSFIEEYNLKDAILCIEDFLKLDDSIVQRIYNDIRTPKEIFLIIDNIYRGNYT